MDGRADHEPIVLRCPPLTRTGALTLGKSARPTRSWHYRVRPGRCVADRVGSPGPQVRIAIAGPIASIAIGLVLLGTAWLGGWLPGTEPTTLVISVLVWLG